MELIERKWVEVRDYTPITGTPEWDTAQALVPSPRPLVAEQVVVQPLSAGTVAVVPANELKFWRLH